MAGHREDKHRIGALDPRARASGMDRNHARKMKLIECIIRPLKLDEVKIALGEIGVTGLTVTDVRGMGRQRGHRETYRGADYAIDMPTKVKLEMVVRDEDVDDIIETVLARAWTGEAGDGKIFVLPMDEAVRIRTEERGDEVL